MIERLGGLAQLARAPALQAGGRRFDSDILHGEFRLQIIDCLKGGRFFKSLKKLKTLTFTAAMLDLLTLFYPETTAYKISHLSPTFLG